MTKWAAHYIHCLTPLHNGAGQGLGSIDRPIIRETTTDYPFIQSSTIKGAYRELAGANDEKSASPQALAAFGVGETTGYQGCLVFTDALLVALPVRSLAGTFAWATSYLALARLGRLLSIGGGGATANAIAALCQAAATAQLIDAHGQVLGCAPLTGEDASWSDATTRIPGIGKVGVESMLLTPSADTAARQALAEVAKSLAGTLFDSTDPYWPRCFRQRLLVLSHHDFDHLVRSATAVEANIRIGPDGVTTSGSLRYTEYLPAESLLASLVAVEPPRATKGASTIDDVWQLYGKLCDMQLQLGADESTGKGFVRVKSQALPAT